MDGDCKSWDLLNNFAISRTNCATLRTYNRADPRTCRGFSRGFCRVAWSHHREHTILLSRKRVNKGMKRMNSLPLSPVAISYAPLRTGNTVTYKSCAKLLPRHLRAFAYRRQLFAQTFWTQSGNSLESLNFLKTTKPNKHKTKSKEFSITWPNLLWNTFATLREF